MASPRAFDPWAWDETALPAAALARVPAVILLGLVVVVRRVVGIKDLAT